MIDLASVFYTLGIIFFLFSFAFLLFLVAFVVSMVRKVNALKREAPMRVISYLKDSNSSQLKALGVAFVGYVLSSLRAKVQASKKSTK